MLLKQLSSFLLENMLYFVRLFEALPSLQKRPFLTQLANTSIGACAAKVRKTRTVNIGSETVSVRSGSETLDD